MGVGAGFYMYVVVVQKFTFAISSPEEFLLIFGGLLYRPPFTDEGQIWCAREDPRSTLIRQISSGCVHCVGFRWPKTTISGKFSLFWGWAPLSTPFLPIRAKFGVL